MGKTTLGKCGDGGDGFLTDHRCSRFLTWPLDSSHSLHLPSLSKEMTQLLGVGVFFVRSRVGLEVCVPRKYRDVRRERCLLQSCRKEVVICKTKQNETKQNEQKCTVLRWSVATGSGLWAGNGCFSFLRRPRSVWVRHLQVCVTESLSLKQCGQVFHSLILGPLVLRIFGSFSG